MDHQKDLNSFYDVLLNCDLIIKTHKVIYFMSQLFFFFLKFFKTLMPCYFHFKLFICSLKLFSLSQSLVPRTRCVFYKMSNHITRYICKKEKYAIYVYIYIERKNKINITIFTSYLYYSMFSYVFLVLHPFLIFSRYPFFLSVD